MSTVLWCFALSTIAVSIGLVIGTSLNKLDKPKRDARGRFCK